MLCPSFIMEKNIKEYLKLVTSCAQTLAEYLTPSCVPKHMIMLDDLIS